MKRFLPLSTAIASAIQGSLTADRYEFQSRPFWGGLCSNYAQDNSAESQHIRNNGQPWKKSGKRKMRIN